MSADRLTGKEALLLRSECFSEQVDKDEATRAATAQLHDAFHKISEAKTEEEMAQAWKAFREAGDAKTAAVNALCNRFARAWPRGDTERP